MSTVVLPAFRVLVPMSIAPNPLEMAPEFRVPVVVRLLKVSIAASTVASVVASRASILFNDVVSPPEKILVLPKVISPPDTIKSPASYISPEPVIFANSGLEPDTTTFFQLAIFVSYFTQKEYVFPNDKY